MSMTKGNESVFCWFRTSVTTVRTVSNAQLLAASRAAASASNCAGIALQAALSVGDSLRRSPNGQTADTYKLLMS